MKDFLRQFKQLRIKRIVMLIIAGIVNAFGVMMFLAPVELYDSGISGTSMLLWQITPDKFTLSLFLIVLNVPLFIYGYRKEGFTFTVYSLIAVCSYSASSYAFANILPVDISTSSPFAGKDLLLCSIFGGIISGIGSGLTIRCGGAIDGIEVLAVIFAKRLGITVGTFVMIYNIILYTMVGIVLQSFILPLYSILTYAAAIKVVDFIVEGFDKAKAAMVITTKANEISAALSEAFGYGITHMPATGYYENTDRTVIYFVVNRFQIARMKNIIDEHDPNAFVTISEISEFMGSDIKFNKFFNNRKKK